MQTKKDRFIQLAIAFLIPVFVAAMPMLLFWAGNAVELVEAIQGLWPVLLSALVGAAVAAAVWFAGGKHCVVTALLGAVISFILTGFSFFFKLAGLLPFLHEGVAALLIAAAVLALAAFAIRRIRDLEFVTLFLPVLCLVLGMLTVFNVFNALRQIEAQPDKVPVASESSADLPNLYLIVSDEMGDFHTMEKYYGIPEEENSFRNYLLEKGFNLSTESYAYRNHTTWCTADLMSLSYVSEPDMTNQEAREISHDGLIFRETAALGYGNAQVSSHKDHHPQLPDLSGEPFAERLVSTITFDGETVFDIWLQRSVFSLLRAFTPEGQATFLDRFSASILDSRMARAERWFLDPASYRHEGPLAVYSYFLAPHTPFYCDAEGNAHPAGERCNWGDTAYYRGAWEYTAAFYQRIFDSIIANDPEAIIILMSDHGVRGGLYTTETVEIDLPDQCRIFNAVYYGGEEFDIEGLSSVNTVRAVLSSLGADFPPVEDPDFMYYQDSPLFATGG